MSDLREISEEIERELQKFRQEFEKQPLTTIPTPYREIITSFVLRGGKRLRPTLFLISYGGYAQKMARNLCRSALALEFLHNFILIHDDIVDHSRTRRGGQSMHAGFEKHLAQYPSAKFSGESAAVIVGDMMYAIGLNMFLSVEELPERKLRAMEWLTRAAVFTACGEMKELFDTLKPPQDVTVENILQTCRWKTAYYSFVCPLVTGASLAGAEDLELDKLMKCAMSLGVAFQIQDDILELTGKDDREGLDPSFSDLREGKLTIPVWYALEHSSRKDSTRLAAALNGGKKSHRDLRTARNIVLQSGGVDYACKKIDQCAGEAQHALTTLNISEVNRRILEGYVKHLLPTARTLFPAHIQEN